MGARFRSWWQQIRKHPVASVLIALFVAVSLLVIFGGYKFNWDWTGFNRPSKTLWDWLQLLGVLAVPVVVGFGAVWFTTRQGKVAAAENKDNQRETALQAYIDKISELLLKEHLGELTEDGKLKPEYEQVRNIARVRTLTILRGLDPIRKASVLQFLQESGLINKVTKFINLNGADLSGVNLQRTINLSSRNISSSSANSANLSKTDLSGANLSFANFYLTILYDANLSQANLSGADLHKAILNGADLSDATLFTANLRSADLSNANLSNADLSEADLSDADLTGVNLKNARSTTITGQYAFVANIAEQLERAKSLKGATMPDGSIHE